LVTRSVLAALVLVLATGCTTNDLPRLAMPKPITIQGKQVLLLWQGGWIAALFVGIIVWGLIVWCIVVYRRRGEEHAPPQIALNLPLEILYTIVPIVFVAVFFYFTARDENNEDKLTPNPKVTVEVVGFQWDWQFNYLDGPGNSAKTIASITGDNAHGSPATLELPTGESVRFKLVSPDVIHSFWVPAFLFKRDVIPGRTNQFEVTIQDGKEGTYIGRCTELCGLNHDQMIFYLKVVSPSTYAADMAKKEAAFTSTGSTS
jgi:cytochrome c oxidase subunit II